MLAWTFLFQYDPIYVSMILFMSVWSYKCQYDPIYVIMIL
jgi:hypothetical protein